jgi:hypothetical protein
VVRIPHGTHQVALRLPLACRQLIHAAAQGLRNRSKEYFVTVEEPREYRVPIGIHDSDRRSARVPEVRKSVSVGEVEQPGARRESSSAMGTQERQALEVSPDVE